MLTDYEYRADQELPSMAFEWRDGSGSVIPFSSGWTFTVKVAKASNPTVVLLTKTAGLVGADSSPNVTILWSTTDFAGLTSTQSGTDYVVWLYARRTADSKDDVFSPGDPPRFKLYPAPA